jgi:hypothetical protein
MDEYKVNPDSGASLTPRSLLAVGLILLGVSQLCGGVAMLLAPIAGPFASSLVGIGLLVVAARVYRGENLLM